MDVLQRITTVRTLRVVDMHTSGESTRIVVDGYPTLEGETLLQKRNLAKQNYDYIRMQLMREPRGHYDMYGAILVQDTELTRRGEADIGVLFCHNEGYSTMCGHATIALGRFLVDTRDEKLFPNRDKLEYNGTYNTTTIKLHAPCGLVHVTVPTMDYKDASTGDVSTISNPMGAVSFVSVPSFVVKADLPLSIPQKYLWPEIITRPSNTDANERTGDPSISVDVAFGGAFYAVVRAEDLGFESCDGRVCYDWRVIQRLDFATEKIKALLDTKMEDLLQPFEGVVEKELMFLYGVTVVDEANGDRAYRNARGVGMDRNLCFFADQQLDRSPTGSCVSARIALAMEKEEQLLGQTWEFHSIVSDPSTGRILPKGVSDAFLGTADRLVLMKGPRTQTAEAKGEAIIKAWTVRVEGRAWYTGTSIFALEKGDSIGEGFLIGR